MDIDLCFSHKLSDDEAKERLKKMLMEEAGKHKNDLKFFEMIPQADGSLVLKGKVLSYSLIGKIEFSPGSVRIKADLPVLVKFFRGRIVAEIQKGMDGLLTV